jgi:pyruvate dehydrogenase E2 component (dihydrolipoamide acetyltransferase)
MIKEFRLPDLGEGLTESEIVNWHVAVGDTVELNQIIADVETAKAVVELPSPYAGVIAELHEQPGTVVEVGAPLVSFEVPAPVGEVRAAPRRRARYPRGGRCPRAAGNPNLVGYGAAVEKGGRPERRARRFAASASGVVTRSAVPAGPVPPRCDFSSDGAPARDRASFACCAFRAGVRRTGSRGHGFPASGRRTSALHSSRAQARTGPRNRP